MHYVNLSHGEHKIILKKDKSCLWQIMLESNSSLLGALQTSRVYHNFIVQNQNTNQ